jgi:hypothetical protein
MILPRTLGELSQTLGELSQTLGELSRTLGEFSRTLEKLSQWSVNINFLSEDFRIIVVENMLDQLYIC